MKLANTMIFRIGMLSVAVAMIALSGVADAQQPKKPAAKEVPKKSMKPAAAKTFEAAVKAAATAKNPGEMILTDVEGRKLEVEVLAANGETLRIKRVEDEKEFEIQLAQLDERSTSRVKKWLDQTPEVMDYAIDFDVEKRLASSDEFETAGRSLKRLQWVYDVKMTNLSRNELSGAKVEYRVVFDDQVAFSRTSAMPGEGADQQDGESTELPEMSYNECAEFTTPKVELHTYKYTPTRGQRDFERDRLIGIWIRITKRGRILEEYRSNPTVMADLVWDGGEKIEIRDSFKDGFSSKKD